MKVTKQLVARLALFSAIPLVLLLILLLTPFGGEFAARLHYLIIHPTEFSVSGLVQSVEAPNGSDSEFTPVANAKVTIYVWDSKYMPWDNGKPLSFETKSDDQGLFHLAKSVGFHILNIRISAQTPDGAQGDVEIHDPKKFAKPQTIIVN